MAADEKTLELIRKLLAKAEGTTFEAEAAAFYAKAQELMAKYAIEEHQLKTDPANPFAGIEERPVSVGGHHPLVKAKRQLLSVVAQANRVRPFTTGRNGRGEYMILVGFSRDIDFVEMLWTSILTHLSTSAEHAARNNNRINPVQYRTSFAHGYVIRIGQRLFAPQDAAITQALVVISNAVDAYVNDSFEHRKDRPGATMGRQPLDPYAMAEGAAAANNADLAFGRQTVTAGA